MLQTTFYDDGEGCLLTVYQGKPKKSVLLLSTEHEKASIDASSEKKKPHTILTYNKTKVGVDSVDQMAKMYTVKSPTRSWPVHIWFNMQKSSNFAVYNHQRVSMLG